MYSLLFADDAVLLDADEDINILFNRVNSQFYNVATYFRKNRLSINPNKTKFIIFSTNLKISIGDNCITLNNNNLNDLNNPIYLSKLDRVLASDSVPAIKYLGVFIDPYFNMNFHAQALCKKISSALYFLRNAKNILDQKALTSVYYALIHSHIIYAIQIWSICNKTLINKIFSLQKRAIRIIHNLKYNAHTESFFKASNILPVPKLIEFFKLQFMQQFTQGLLPSSFANVWTTNNTRRINSQYHLRNHEDIHVPPARLLLTENHPLHSFPRSWLQFDEHNIKIQREKSSFNSMLKKYLCDKLSSNYICNRLFCPSCTIQPIAPYTGDAQS